MATMADWMGTLPDTAKLYQITMPGSHDAGINTGDATGTGVGKAKMSLAICQDVGIGLQCIRGSRFFDVRPEVTSGGAIRTYHKTAGQGALGESLGSIYNDVYQFLQSHPSEFVILRISKPKGSRGDMFQAVNNSRLSEKLYKSGPTNLANVPIGELRGKAICCYDTVRTTPGWLGKKMGKTGKVPFPVVGPMQGQHSFSRYTGSGANQTGVVTCGKYSSSDKLWKVIDGQVAHIDSHADHARGDHLFVLYWTQTVFGNIRATTMAEAGFAKEKKRMRISGGAHKNMQFLTDMLAKGRGIPGSKQPNVITTNRFERQIIMPNVVMYDFINDEMSRQIVALNNPGLMAHLQYEEDNPWQM